MNRIKFRRGSLNNKKNIDIEEGEPIYLTDTKRLYVSNEDVAINNVYVGSQEPNDPGINVWIDPQGINSGVIDMIYPIGRGFIDFTNTDYSNYLGFTWERELVGMFPVGYDPTDEDFNEIGKTGGSKSLQTHTHAISGDGSHYHIGVGRYASGSGYSNIYESYASGASVREIRTPYSGSNGGHTHTISPTGGSKAGEDFNSSPNNGNVPPYQVVAYWKRVA